MAKHRVVIIGSGFGGLFAAQSLKKEDVEVTVISKTTHHLFQPLLYQVATGILSEGEIAPSTREVLSKQQNARVVLGEVLDIDLDKRVVTSVLARRDDALNTPMHTEYDSLIVAAGSGQSYFGNDQFAEFAPGLKSVDDALELRGRIFGAFEVAEVGRSQEEIDRALTFLVVGAGPTGVEMAGQIAELSNRTLPHDFRRIDPRNARVILLDAADAVLPPFGKNLGDKARKKLESLGVEVQLGSMVTDVDSQGITVRDKDGSTRRIEAMAKVWAAGVQASALTQTLARQSGAELDRAGRIAVENDLTLPGHPEVFVVGDMITLNHYPGVAQLAIQGGRHAAKQIIRRLQAVADRTVERPEDMPAEQFVYNDKGSMATISRFNAVAKVGKFELTGFLAWLSWLGVHLIYIIGFKQRITTLLHWTISFVGKGRSERTVTHQQVFARTHMRKIKDSKAPEAPAAEPPPQASEKASGH